MIEYNLIRSRRKSMSIRILENGVVEVRSPLLLSKKDIDKFILSKSHWINEKVFEMKKRAEKRKLFSLTYGSKVIFKGDIYKLISTDKYFIWFSENAIHVPCNLNETKIKQMLIEKFKDEAKKEIKERVVYFSGIMNLKPSKVKISNAKTRWGSCSGKNRLNFSWKLILANESLLDYVIIHELAHIKEHNHSHNFWSIVENFMPNYKDEKIKLKLFQQRLNAEYWDL